MDQIVLLAPEDLHAHNVEVTRLPPFLKVLERTAARVLRGDRSSRDLAVVVVLHPDRAPSLRLAARPALPRALGRKLRQSLDAAGDLRTRHLDFPLLLVMKVNHGCPDSSLPLQPPVMKPSEEQREQFRRVSLAGKVAEVRRWARAVLPLLGSILASVDARFVGVRELGQALKAAPAGAPPDVARTTDHSATYWRAVVEMTPGDKAVVLARILLLVARGQLDRARRMVQVYLGFAAEKSTSRYLLEELEWRLRAAHEQEYALLKRGMTLHDQKRFGEAIRLYREVLAANPHSALALWEIYFSRAMDAATRAGRGKPSFDDWGRARQAIYEADPLFSMDARASTGVEAYRAFRRLELREVEGGRVTGVKALFLLADVALELGVYSRAAELYWLTLTHVKESAHGGRDVLGRFLYSLEKLGVTRLKEAFKGDHAARFQKIEALLRAQMTGHVAFRAMCVSGLGPQPAGACPSGKKRNDVYIEWKSPPKP